MKLLFGLVIVAVMVTLSCGSSESEVRDSATAIPPSLSTWSTYENSSIGLSFRYPSSMTLRLDQPLTSGIQIDDDNLAISIIINPETHQTIDSYLSQLGATGFTERRRSSLTHGSWIGFRVEGSASFGDRFLFDEVLYVITSGSKMLTLIALWETSPLDFEVVNTMWESLQIDGTIASLSPPSSNTLTTYTAPDGKFSLRYPTRWQASVLGESQLYFLDPSGDENFLVSVSSKGGTGLDANSIADEELLIIKSGFGNVNKIRENIVHVSGASEAFQINGSLMFKDGLPGKFQTTVVVTPSDSYVLTAIFTEESNPLELDGVFNSFRISTP